MNARCKVLINRSVADMYIDGKLIVIKTKSKSEAETCYKKLKKVLAQS